MIPPTGLRRIMLLPRETKNAAAIIFLGGGTANPRRLGSVTFRQGLAVRALDCPGQGILLAFERLREFLLRRGLGASSPLPRKIY